MNAIAIVQSGCNEGRKERFCRGEGRMKTCSVKEVVGESFSDVRDL